MFELRRIKIISLFFIALQVILLFILLSFIFRIPSSFIWPVLCLLIIILISIFFFTTILFLLNLYLENNKDLNDLVEHKNLEINKLTDIQHKNIIAENKEKTISIDVKKIKQRVIPCKKITEYSLETYTKELLFNVAKEVEAVQGLLYIKERKKFNMVMSYAYHSEQTPQSFQLGEGISGQAVKNKKILYLSDIPENYMKVFSGLGIGKPKYLLMLPIIHNKTAIGLIELATFRPVKEEIQNILFSISREVAKNIVLLSKENKQL
jgi:transcriptional regulator with GAF, ATPase, and Fis domain